MKKRVYFEKKDEMKFISHLDLVRFLERLFKIAGIQLEYTKGFHPRPKLSFGNPISIGEEALYEPFDIDLEADMENDEVLDRLNAKAPKGFKILKVEDRVSKGSIIKDFDAIEYELSFEDLDDLEKLMALFDLDEIIEEKVKRGKVKRRDLKEKVVSYNKDENRINVILDNISPNAYFRKLEVDMTKITIKRLRYVNI